MAGTGRTKRFGTSHSQKASLGLRTDLLREWISKPIERFLKLIDIQRQVFKKAVVNKRTQKGEKTG